VVRGRGHVVIGRWPQVTVETAALACRAWWPGAWALDEVNCQRRLLDGRLRAEA